MDFIQNLFSSAPSLNRLNPVGIALMVIGVISALPLSALAEKRGGNMSGMAVPLKILGLLLACAGALLAMYKL